jgi:uncharacterized protein (TIGR02246 family)
MRLCSYKVVLVCLTAAMVNEVMAQSADDEQAIRNLAQQYETGWNSHDMSLLGAMRAENIDFVVVTGEHRKGREASMAQLGEQHRTQFRDSVWTNEKVSVQFLRPDVALVHVEWGIKGDRNVDDTSRPPRKGIFTWVVVRDAGAWRLRAAHNTNKQR